MHDFACSQTRCRSILRLSENTAIMIPKSATHLDIDGLQLEYRRYGSSGDDRPTLVLLHEGLGCVERWKTFPELLAEATGCQALAYSRRGYGSSIGRLPPWPLTYMHEEALEVLPRVLDVAAIDRAILIGHSDGASIALIQAGGGNDPRLQAMVLMAPHVFVEQVAVDSIRQARAAFEGDDLRERLERYHGDNVDDAFRGWNGAWLDPGFRQWNIEPYLASISIPLLLIQGEDDQYGSHRQLESIAGRVRGPVTTCLLPDCRHSPHLDQPEATLREIARFVTALISADHRSSSPV